MKAMWGWYLALGIFLIAAGVYAVMEGTAATLASVIVIGAVIFVAGIAQLVGAFMSRGAGHIILLLLVGVLDVIVGIMLMQHPGIGALTLTLFLAVLFVFGGIFRFTTALMLRFPHFGWSAISGVISVVLGVLLWIQWPFSAAWFIGFAVGLNFIFAGLMWSTMAWKLRSLPA
jgi:uncharacterized membrane protein HdeD (DUF308 family)